MENQVVVEVKLGPNTARAVTSQAEFLRSRLNVDEILEDRLRRILEYLYHSMITELRNDRDTTYFKLKILTDFLSIHRPSVLKDFEEWKKYTGIA